MGPSEVVIADASSAPGASPPAPGAAVLGRRFWLRSALLYLLVNLPFLVLTLDTYNLNGDVYSSSFLALGLNPYHAATNVGQGFLIIPGAGYFILPYNSVAFLAYPAFGFNAIAASALLKLIGLAAGFLAARVVYEIAVREGAPGAKAIFYAVLFNPFLIFVNSVAGDADLVVVFLVVLAVFLFRYGWVRPVHLPAVLLGAVAISLTVLSYYFTLLLVPTLLLWIDGRKAKVLAVGLLGAVVAVLAVPIVALGLGSPNPSSLAGPVQVTGYSFPYYLSPSAMGFFGSNQVAFTGLAVIFAILVPVLFRRWGIGEGTALLTVLVLAFALTFRLPSDVFSVLAAFVPLSFALGPSRKAVSYGKCLLFQAFLVPVYILVEMFNGPGQVSGVLYWFYPFLHRNTILYSALGGAHVATGLFLAYVVGTAVTVIVLVRRERRATATPGPERTTAARPALRPAPATRGTYVVALVVAALLVGIPMGVALAPSSPSSLRSDGQLNSLEFYAYDASNPLLYPLPGPNSFSVDPTDGILTVTGGSAPVALARSVTETTNRVDLSVTVDPSTNAGPVPVWLSNQSELVYSSMLSPASSGVRWTPQPPVAPPIVEGTSVIHPPTPVYGVADGTVLQYVEPWSSLVGHEEFFGAQYSQGAWRENTLWSAALGPGRTVQCYVAGNTVYLSVENGTRTTVASALMSAVRGEWFLGGITVDPVRNTITMAVNNANVTATAPLPSAGNVTFDFGNYNQTGSVGLQESWTGNITAVTSLAPSQVAFVPGFFASTVDRAQPTWVGGGNSSALTYGSSGSGGWFAVNGTNLTLAGADSWIGFGKLALSPASVVVQVGHLDFVRAASGLDFAWVVVGFGVLLPIWMFLWCGREVWWSLRRQ